MAGCLLRLRGLPFSATAEEVQSFFAEHERGLRAVYLAQRNGKPTGEAYVEFESASEASKALEDRQHKHMGNRYIEIFVAGEADLLATTSGAPGGAPSLVGHVVRLRGLPFNSTAADVLAFFEGVDTVGGEAGIVFTCTPDGRPTGEAYVELAGEEALAGALARHKEKIGARYIEIFESSKGDMYQAVQQHGYFTSVAGRRRHHWHQQHSPGAAAAAAAAAVGQYAQDAGGGGRQQGSRGGSMEEMTNAFAGFGLSQRDMQVPGPPRWGGYGAPADQQYQQYGGVPPRQMQQAGIMAPGPMRWRPAAGQMQPGMQHFNPAPGPPPGKGGRSGVANGTRQQSGASGGMMEYGSHGQQAASWFNPFMMQHPLMVQVPHGQQHHGGAAWGTPGMMQQQGGAWYGGMQMGRGMQGMGGMQMGMAGYGSYPAAGYYAAMRAPGPSHHQQQHVGARHQSQAGPGAGPAMSAASYTGTTSQFGTAAAAATPATPPAAEAAGGQPAAEPEAPVVAAAPAAPEEQPAAAGAQSPAVAAPPETPEQ